MNKYKSFKKEKLVFLILSIAFYFVPFIVTTACLLPFVKEAEGTKFAIGFGVVIINTLPFLMGVFKSFFSHFPLINMLAIVFLLLGAFFRMDVFRTYADTFLWIELAAGVGSVVACVLWAFYRKYANYSKTVKATVKSGIVP